MSHLFCMRNVPALLKDGKCVGENWLEVQKYKCILLTAMNFTRPLPE